MISGSTRLYAIIGDPVAHVRTPVAFNDYFASRNIDAVCLPIQIGRGDLSRGWAGLKSILNLDGFIVTAPHKAQSAELCDALEGDGAYTRVVNTIRREASGRFVGTLFDGRGFVSGLMSQGHPVEGRRFYLAGAGGAGTALGYALAAKGAAAVTIHNRTRSKAEKLVAGISTAFPNCEVRLGTSDASGHAVAVNATSLGLKADDPHAFDIATAEPDALIAEVIMKPQLTPLLAAAKARGHKIHFGTHMLEGQLILMMEFLGVGTPASSVRDRSDEEGRAQ
jgi:shikimate dehydrogenase